MLELNSSVAAGGEEEVQRREKGNLTAHGFTSGTYEHQAHAHLALLVMCIANVVWLMDHLPLHHFGGKSEH